MVHARLKDVKHQQDPLKIVAAQLAENLRVLCPDEFFVADITDAMLLHHLLAALFERAWCWSRPPTSRPTCCTGTACQRARFLPAIELLKTHCEVVNVDGGTDYRLRYLERAEIYHHPLDARRDRAGRDLPLPGPGAGPATMPGWRSGSLRTRELADGVVWFDFAEICDGPRSQNDYIEIARQFHTVLIGRVPVLDWTMENAGASWNLVDEFYDRNVKLILAAAAPRSDLHRRKLKFEYQRTVSRLQEMQSKEFLARPP